MQVCGVHFSSQTEKKKQNRDVRKDRKEQWNGEQSECMTEQSEKNAKETKWAEEVKQKMYHVLG